MCLTVHRLGNNNVNTKADDPPPPVISHRIRESTIRLQRRIDYSCTQINGSSHCNNYKPSIQVIQISVKDHRSFPLLSARFVHEVYKMNA